MQYWIDLALILAQSYSDSLYKFQLGVTVAGVATMITGAAIGFSKPKPTDKPTSPAVKWTAASLLMLVGLGIVIYAWTGF